MRSATNGDAPTQGSALLDFPAAQDYLGGVCRSTVKKLVWDGILQPVRIGKRVLFPRSTLDEYIESLQKEAVT